MVYIFMHTYIHTYIHIYISNFKVFLLLKQHGLAQLVCWITGALIFLILSHDIMCKNQCDARSEPCLSLFAGRQYRRRCEKVFMSSCSTSTVDTNWTWPPGSFQRDNSHLLKFTKGALKVSYLEQNS